MVVVLGCGSGGIQPSRNFPTLAPSQLTDDGGCRQWFVGGTGLLHHHGTVQHNTQHSTTHSRAASYTQTEQTGPKLMSICLPRAGITSRSDQGPLSTTLARKDGSCRPRKLRVSAEDVGVMVRRKSWKTTGFPKQSRRDGGRGGSRGMSSREAATDEGWI